MENLNNEAVTIARLGAAAVGLVAVFSTSIQESDLDQLGLNSVRTAIWEQREGHAVLRGYRKDNGLFQNDFNIATVRDNAGKVTHLVVVLNDIAAGTLMMTAMLAGMTSGMSAALALVVRLPGIGGVFGRVP